MKKYLVLIVFVALFAACMSLKSFAVYEPGRWEGRGEGYNGMILVLVETDTASILDINVLAQNEDAMIGGDAIRSLKEFILDTDSTDIDAVSGATLTSEGFLEAVNNALSKARIKR
ncbi:MAG: FMN-binding protein [Spirochaetaceae bacterium]|jgi:fumarate reductase flavoprotein subunit|nr:FMN-binding protein [Spirochaetaceae bacterium]